MKKVNSLFASPCDSSSWPVCREKVWKSFTAPGIGRDHLQHLARVMIAQRLLRAQDRQRAIQPARVEFLVEVHEVIMPHGRSVPTRGHPGRTADPAAADGWLLTVAQLPTDDPASRMRVLRTLESLGAAVMREGVYLLPDTAANRHSLEALTEYIFKIAGSGARAAGRRRVAGAAAGVPRCCSTAPRATRS